MSSKTVDERVVSMRFDNRHFESNVATTMSTLDKLKSKLNFSGAAKGLEDVGTAARKVDMSNLGAGVESVSAKFSALQVMGVTALANITNSAVEAGKRIASALTIDPIKTGLSEYETKINAVQVIKANTRGQYESEEAQMEAINKALSDLNDYADRTIYNYTQMTNNVGKFVAQGLTIEKATKAVEGMANLAGASGASAEDMSRATYQMSQALGGTIRKIDWNSLRNANMATVELKNLLMDLAKLEGIDIDGMIAEKGTFEDTLEKGWLTGDMFTEAMNIYSDVYSEAELKAKGFTDEQVANLKDLARVAKEATTEVKTMSQLWDVLKETAQSGWTQTWELIFGDFNEAKKMFTSLQVYFSNILNGISDARNTLLGGALNMGDIWANITDKLSNVTGLTKIKEITDSIGNYADKVAYFQDVVTAVWRGDYNNHGDNPDRYDLLEQAGYDHRVVQDLVNKGYLYQITVEDIEASHKKFGLTMDKTTESTEKVTEAVNELSDAQLKKAGLTKAEIRLYRDLEEEAARTGRTIGEVADEMSKMNGRQMLIDSLTNAGKGLVTIITAIKDAWVDVFPPMSVVTLYNIIKAIKEFSEKLLVSEETADKVKRTFKGVFAIIDVITTILGGGFKIAFKVITQLLGAFNLNILDLTAMVGDAAVGFRDWMDSVLDFTSIFEKIVPYLDQVKDGIKGWIDGLKSSEDLPHDIITGLAQGLVNGTKWIAKAAVEVGKAIWTGITDFFKGQNGASSSIVSSIANGLKDGAIILGTAAIDLAEYLLTKLCTALGIDTPSSGFFQAGKDAVAGFINGLKEGVGNVISTIWEFGTSFISNLRLSLDEHSPSKATHQAGVDFMQGFINGIKEMLSGAWELLKSFGAKCIELVKELDLGTVLTAGIGIGSFIVTNKIAGALETLTSPLEGFGDILDEVAKRTPRLMRKVIKVVNGFSKVLGSVSTKIKASALKDIAIAIAILVGALALLTFLDINKLWGAIGIMAALASVLMVLMASVNMSKSVTDGFDTLGLSLVLVGIGVAVILMAAALKKIETLDPAKAEQTFWIFAGLIGAIMAVLAVYGKLVKGKAAANIGKAGTTMLLIAGSMLILVGIAKLMSSMDWPEMGKAAAGIGGLIVVVALMMLITRIAGKNVGKAGVALLEIAGAMLIMAVVAKIIASMNWYEMGRAAAGLAFFTALIIGLVASMKLLEKDYKSAATIAKVGKTILAIAGAMAILAIAAKLIASMTWGDMGKAAVGLAGLTGVIMALVYSTKFVSGKDLTKVGVTMLLLSVSIGVLAMIASLLGLVSIPNLAKGIVAVGLLSIIMAQLIKATWYAKDCKDELIVMTVAIGIMAAAIGLLSFIDPSRLAGATAAMGAVMGIFALMILASSKAATTMGPLIVMTVAIGLIAGMIYLLGQLPMDVALSASAGLSAVLIAMALALAVTGTIGTISKSAFLVIGAMTLVVAALVGILYLMRDMPIETTIPNAIALSTLLLTMSAVLAVLTVIGLGGPAALIGIGSLAALIVGIGGLIVGIGHLVDKFPMLSKFLDTGIPILEKIGFAIGAFFGAIFTGFSAAFAATLPIIGACLSGFMIAAIPFVEGIKMVDDSMLSKVAILSGAILLLTAADFVAGLMTLGGISLVSLGLSLSAFMVSLKPFLDGVSELSPESMVGIKSLAEAILILTAADIMNGISSFLTGGSSLATFGAQLEGLGTNLKDFADNLGTFDKTKVTSVTNASEVIKALAGAAKDLPNDGGLFGRIFGENSIATFGGYLPDLATNLKTFADNLGTFDKTKVDTITCASDAILAIANSAKKLPNEGGKIAELLGDNSIATFGKNLPPLGDNLKKFADNLGTFDNTSISTVSSAVKVIKALAELANTNLKKAAKHLTGFGDDLPEFASHVSDFCTKMPSSDAISTAVDDINKVLSAVSSIGDSDSGVLAEFAENLKKVGENAIKKFVEAFTSKIAKLDVKEAATELAGEAVSGAESKKGEMKTAGKDLGAGLVEGIKAKMQAVYNAAYALGQEAVRGEKDGQASNSPSKLTILAGRWIGEGLIVGMREMGKKVYKSGSELGESATGSVSSVMANLASILDSDIDSQPTIRPVMDLSDVKAGTGALNNMLNFGSSIGVSANVGAISSMMNRRVQNGDNGEVVSAINKLRNDLGKVGNTYNSINGVSVDGNTAVEDAIQTLVRAINIEGRA